MNALIQEATAVLRPGASPRRLRVIILIAIPTDVDGAVREPSEMPLVERATYFFDGRIKPILMTDRDLDIILFRALDDRVGIGNTHRHGFFDDHINAAINAIECNRCVRAAARRYADELGALLRQHFFVIGILLDVGVVESVPIENLRHFITIKVGNGDKCQAVVLSGRKVVGGNSAAPDQGVFHYC